MPLPPLTRANAILRGQALAFSGLIAVVWIVELLNLPQHLFDTPPEHRWQRIVARTLIVAVIWLIVHRSTARLLKRLHELEAYLRICGWCRKVDDRGEWRSLEDYFDTRFHTATSHGICPECSRQQLVETLATDRPASGRLRPPDAGAEARRPSPES